MTNLRKDALKAPVYHILIVTLLAVGFVSLPLGKLFSLFIKDSFYANISGGMVLRIILSVVAIIAIYKYGFIKQFTNKVGIVSILMVLPALVVAVNNFPIITAANGTVTITNDAGKIILYVFYCLSVGVFEESVFCGIVFPLCYYILKDKKNHIFWSVALSSAIFACSHLVNLFGGAGFGSTMLQVGYTFLIGSMSCICKCVTENLITAISIHFIYDIGGLITDERIGIATGARWDNVTIIITAVIGVIVCVYMIFMLLKLKDKNIEALYGFNEITEKSEDIDESKV